MQIEEKGTIESFEAMPKEQILYMTAICYKSGGWMAGPCGTNKNEVINTLQNFTGIEIARIYSVKVPIKSLPAA